MATVFLYDHRFEALPVLGKRTDLNLVRIELRAVGGMTQKETLCGPGASLRELDVVQVGTFRRSPCVDRDAVDARGVYEIVLDVCGCFAVRQIGLIELGFVEPVVDCEFFGDGCVFFLRDTFENVTFSVRNR